MQTAYRFKLIPDDNQEQIMSSWLGMLRGVVNYSLADRIDSYNQGFILRNFCSLRFKAEACPLTCSVNRSASLGNPWKEDKPNLRRPLKKKKKVEEESKFNPRRTAYEMQRDQDVPDLPSKTLSELQSVNGVDRGIKKIAAMADGTGEPNLPLVKRKVTPRPELTGCKERSRKLSPGWPGEPRNLVRNRERVAVYVQLSLFDDISGESPPIAPA